MPDITMYTKDGLPDTKNDKWRDYLALEMGRALHAQCYRDGYEAYAWDELTGYERDEYAFKAKEILEFPSAEAMMESNKRLAERIEQLDSELLWEIARGERMGE